MLETLLALLVVVAAFVLRRLSRRRKALLERVYGKAIELATGTGAQPSRFVGNGESLIVAGIALRDPLVYASRRALPRRGREGGKVVEVRVVRGGDRDPGEIGLELEVAGALPPHHESLADLPYWPSYERATPAQRRAYLAWLAAGRASPPPGPSGGGFRFLHYYGLERRRLVERKDRDAIVREVIRQLAMDAADASATPAGGRRSRSFRRYATALLWFDAALEPDSLAPDDFAARLAATEEFDDDSLRAALAVLARRAAPLPSRLALEVAMRQPLATRGKVRERTRERFDALFHLRYSERFPSGLVLAPGKPTRLAYRAANAALGEFVVAIDDPSSRREAFEPLVAIHESCVADLRRFARVSAGAPDLADLADLAALAARDPAAACAAYEALPDELREEAEHPAAAALRARISAASPERDGEDVVLLAASDLMADPALGVAPRGADELRFTPQESRRLAIAIEAAGFAIEPDPRRTGRGYRRDEFLAVHPAAADAAGTGDASRGAAAAVMLRLALDVVGADGRIDDQELERVTRGIEAAFSLSEAERRRLHALRALLLRAGSDVRHVARRLEKTLPEKDRYGLGRLLVAIAAEGGAIGRKELAALRRCFRGLALPAERLDAVIAELVPDEDESLVAAIEGDAAVESGAPIPPPERETLRLDRVRIHRLLAETREVSLLLAEAMANGERDVADESEESGGAAPSEASEPRSIEPSAAAAPPPAPGPSPPARYAAFHAALAANARWTREEAQSLATRHGVMLDGALEALNEWSFDALGEPLVEEDGETLLLRRPPQGSGVAAHRDPPTR
jgi:uncharacterized tellurite resistance protein B-like protein